MRGIMVFLYEWKHFLRSPFKLIALLLFVIAAINGLHNGSALYKKQITEIQKIQQNVKEQKQQFFTRYDEGKLISEDRPWIDLSTPFWAIRSIPTYQIKAPSTAIVYSIGQAEQYGFYKRISFWASPYDADMAEEIANPERLQTGTLDFAFAMLFLLPLLLLILLFNLKSKEAEQGFLTLIEVQTASKNKWLISRMAFYLMLCALVCLGLLLYGAMLTNVFETTSGIFGQMIFYSLLYLVFWSVIYFFVLKYGKSILGNTLQMIGIWLLLAFIIPALVHQGVSIVKPTNLMTNFIDTDREKRQELFDQPDSIFQEKLNVLFPPIEHSPVFKDKTKIDRARSQSAIALVNELKKESIQRIEMENNDKNSWIKSTFWFNPVSFFQNRFNAISTTHYENYETYRKDIQAMIDKRIEVLVLDIWNNKKVNKEDFIKYTEMLSKVK